MGKSWDDASEKQLLLSVIHVLNITAPDWNKVAAMMGEGYTASAVSQKFNKIKKACKEQYGDPDGESAAAPKATPGSGAKRGRPKKAAAESAGKGKGKKNEVLAAEDGDDEADDVEESPTKRLNKEESVPAEHSVDEEL